MDCKEKYTLHHTILHHTTPQSHHRLYTDIGKRWGENVKKETKISEDGDCSGVDWS
jgi:hypothetical protein